MLTGPSDLGKALYRYGATGFRTELYLRYISKALEIPADFATFPSLILTSFGVPQITTRSSRTFLDFAPHGYDMGKLYQTTKLGERLCDMAIEDLDVILNSPGTWSQDWVQAMAFGSAGASAVIVIFSGSWLDVLISFLVGSLIGVVSTFAPRIFPNYVNLIELVSSLLTTIILRIIQTCMPAMCLSFVPIFLSCILIHLPGLSFTLSLLELSAQNLVSGTARLVSSLLIALLLAAGVVIGSAIPGLAQFFATGPGPDISNTCTPLDPVTSLAWVAAMFPVLTFSLTINMRASLQEAPVVFLAALCGFSTYTLCDSVWSLNSAASSALSSFVVGLVGNIYARCGGLAMVPVLTGILILVPGSKGVRGSLQMMLDTDIGSSNAVSEMFFVALWLNIGLLFSTVVVYPQRGSFIEGEHLFRGF
ncbi:uncharacterized protein BJ171DRAFT_457729 [Polychytrium aggregatum]|uniref:uncharacterized protein n=1 Tax=Polychytrium aggregatum TaxID=110093 RepID=UPI0022FE6B03|nr:uncharacterized protein BJ171DRAFT_457729 [Polychytrium aggregatum]KAI9206136.1 hypothetical protein BJ171DRAFT_457729 [Polychytrium aggregatum]